MLTDYGDIDRAVELLTAAQRMAGEGLTETRRAVHALRSDTLPLAEELAKAASTYGERYHVAVSLDTRGHAAAGARRGDGRAAPRRAGGHGQRG